MGNMPTTRNGYNFWDMLSMLQKACRRGDYEHAGVAAYEMVITYRGALWNRIAVISAEDCCGAFTKELIQLRLYDEKLNKGKTPYQFSLSPLSAAIGILSEVKKSRDACYWGCNFLLSTEFNQCNDYHVTDDEIESMEEKIKAIADEDMDFKNINKASHEVVYTGFQQMDLFGKQKTVMPEYRYAAKFEKAVEMVDMYAAGRMLALLRKDYRTVMWKMFMVIAKDFGGLLCKEIIGLKVADDLLNGKKALDKKEDIFICKAAVLLLYQAAGHDDWLYCHEMIVPEDLIDWKGRKIKWKPLAQCRLGTDGIPEWVYDCHTLKGKRMGKTDWEMNIVEQAALNPLQRAFFDEGSWESLYEWLKATGQCGEAEYQEEVKYRENHENNPAKIFQKYTE